MVSLFILNAWAQAWCKMGQVLHYCSCIYLLRRAAFAAFFFYTHSERGSSGTTAQAVQHHG